MNHDISHKGHKRHKARKTYLALPLAARVANWGVSINKATRAKEGIKFIAFCLCALCVKFFCLFYYYYSAKFCVTAVDMGVSHFL